MQKKNTYILDVDEISPSEKEYKINAKPDMLKQITEILKVPDVKEFIASIYVRRKNKSPLIDVWGRVDAVITRQSVISLEFFDKNYESEFILQYDTTLTDAMVRELEDEGEVNIPDVVYNRQIDLKQIAIEQIALELEDHPRQEGEEFRFTSEFSDEDIKAENPFKILEKLKK